MFVTSLNGQNTAKAFLIVLGGNPRFVLVCDDISSEYPLIPVKLFYICLYKQGKIHPGIFTGYCLADQLSFNVTCCNYEWNLFVHFTIF